MKIDARADLSPRTETLLALRLFLADGYPSRIVRATVLWRRSRLEGFFKSSGAPLDIPETTSLGCVDCGVEATLGGIRE